MSDLQQTRKLRPLIPKPTTSNIPKNTTHSSSMTNSSNYICSCNRSTPHFSLNHNKGSETNTQLSVMSSRWNPTSEQLRALEEMYVCGTRTPTAEQIQQITAKLRKFGKIEGKNVFYWFQNHKARERQKRRRILESRLCEEQVLYGFENPQELNRTSFEFGQRKKWATPSNCSTLSEECVSIHRAVAAESETTDGWTQFEERESIIIAKNATLQTPSIYLLNTVEDFGTNELKLSTNNTKEDCFTYNEDNESRESQTLQLFPYSRSDEWNDVKALDDNDTELPVTTTMRTNFSPNQFFEFLPLKN